MKTICKCAVCGKVGGGRVPRHGDGSLRYARKHYVDGVECEGSWLFEAELLPSPIVTPQPILDEPEPTQ